MLSKKVFNSLFIIYSHKNYLVVDPHLLISCCSTTQRHQYNSVLTEIGVMVITFPAAMLRHKVH